MMDAKREKPDWINVAAAVIAIGLISILGFLSWALVYVNIPNNNETTMGLLIGILSAQISVVINSLYVANKKQTDTINTLAKTADKAQAALAPLTPVPDVVLAPGESATVTTENPPA